MSASQSTVQKAETATSSAVSPDLLKVDKEDKEDKALASIVTDEEWQSSPHYPRNWAKSKRWKNALIISVTGFLATTGSSIIVPSTPVLSLEYNAPHEVAVLPAALYVLGLGLGPFLFAPWSELKGRKQAYAASMVGFTILSIGCAFANNLEGLIILRFISGAFASSGPGLGVATISDLFAPQERGLPISIYAIGPALGPVLGSVIGSYLILIGWRWNFRIMAILIGLNTLAMILFMDETYEAVARERYELSKLPKSRRRTFSDLLRYRMTPKARAVVSRTFSRPPRMLLNPACAIFITYYSYVYSIIYLYLVALPLLFSRHMPPQQLFSYNWPAGTAGLCYFGLGIGFMCASATAALGQDRIYKYCSQKYQDEGRPEYRLILCQLGMIVFPVGLLVWGWTAQAETHWIGPIIGSVIFGFGLMLAFNAIQNWIVDAFFPYSAAAMAAASLVRSITGCILPIFANQLFQTLGYGWGGTTLALVSLPALPAPLVLFMYGKQLRERFKFEP